MDDPEFRTIVEAFVGGLDEKLEELRATVASGDLAELPPLAHSLKGSGGMAGFRALHDAAERLETLAMNEDLEAIQASVEEIAAVIERIHMGASVSSNTNRDAAAHSGAGDET